MSDDVGAIVLDCGSSSVLAGYAGEDCPKVNFASVRYDGGDGDAKSCISLSVYWHLK